MSGTSEDRQPFFVRTDREVVRVSGPDALTYLQGQTSQDLLPMAVGDRRWTFLLQPSGKVDVLARVARAADDTFVFDVDAGYGDALVARLNRFKIRVRVDVEVVPWRVLGVIGGTDVVGSDPEPPAGVPEGTAAELEAVRVAAGWPAMGSEIEPGETIPGETGVVAVAVDFRKGCYPGQELVERMDSPRRDGAAQPADPRRPRRRPSRRSDRARGSGRGDDHIGRRDGRARLRQARCRDRGASRSTDRRRVNP